MEPPHDPAPPEPKRLLPEWPYVARGVLLAATSAIAVIGAGAMGRKSQWLIPAALPVVFAGVMAAWAAAIQLTGGQQQDDHPWV